MKWICLLTLVACTSTAPRAETLAEYDELLGVAAHFRVQDGDWLDDLGDAPFYGLALYAHIGDDERARPARERARRLLVDHDFLKDDLQELVTSALGLIEAAALDGDEGDRALIDAFMADMDAVLQLFGDDLSGVPGWAIKTYGTTAVTALVGYAFARAEKTEIALRLDRFLEKRWRNDGYRFGGERTDLDLYPNVAMIALKVELYRLTRDAAHRDRAVAAARAIESLRLPDGRYYSEYSAAEFGATTTDFSTLSSQNYLAYALMALFEIGGDGHWLERADDVLVATEKTMRGPGGELLHHWIDGRPALPADPTYFCAGCNLQHLFVLWYRHHAITGVR